MNRCVHTQYPKVERNTSFVAKLYIECGITQRSEYWPLVDHVRFSIPLVQSGGSIRRIVDRGNIGAVLLLDTVPLFHSRRFLSSESAGGDVIDLKGLWIDDNTICRTCLFDRDIAIQHILAYLLRYSGLWTAPTTAARRLNLEGLTRLETVCGKQRIEPRAIVAPAADNFRRTGDIDFI